LPAPLFQAQADRLALGVDSNLHGRALDVDDQPKLDRW
jgi:hypothetical protein